jgi:Secretion system C-terminal sorting domain
LEGVLYGVYSFRPNGTAPASFLNVNNSSFIRFSKDAISAVVNPAVFIPLNMSSFQVTNCLFDDNAIVTGTRRGVLALSGAATSGAGFKFINNKMYHRARPTDDFYKLHCFSLTLIDGGVGHYNELYDEGTLFFTSPNEFIGVRMSSCKNFSWASNDFIGNQISGFNNEFAFDIGDSPSCYYSCNFMDDLWDGMRFFNICSGSRLTQNSFNHHASHGISLDVNGTEIGQQILRGNSWNSTGIGREAFMEFPGYNPFNLNHRIQVQKSLFQIHTNNQNTVSWANPRVVETGGNDPHWFVGPTEGGPYLAQLCIEPSFPVPGDLDGVERGLLTGNYTPYRGFAANTWEAEFHLNDKLLTNPDLRPTGSEEDTWYQGKYNTNLGKLVRVYRGMVNLTAPTPSGSANQLLADLSAVNTATQYEQNLKFVLQIALTESTTETSTVTAAQLLQLQAIAQQCRFEGGLGVAIARAMLKMALVLENDCPPELGYNDSENSSASLKVAIFPNPVNEALYLSLDRRLANGQVSLYNLAGQQVRQWSINGDQATCSVTGLLNGIYLLEALDSSGQVFRSKIVVNR